MDVEKYFEILGISSHSSIDEVKQAYRDLVNVWHPDRFNHNERLRKKAEEELKKINLAYSEIHQFFSCERERQRLKAEEEERVKRDAVMRAKSKSQAKARMQQETKTEHYSEDDWNSRILCGDGCCIGIIGKDGRCKECGKTLGETSNDRNATRNDFPQDNMDDDKQTDWDNRVLCSDGACIGIMGLDGRCTQCGKRLR